jgi:hypothetical protein
MPPKRRPKKELPAEGSSQAVGGQIFTTTQTTVQTTHIPQIAHPQPSTEPHVATIEARWPADPVERPTTKAEVLSMNTSALNTLPPPRSNTKPSKSKRTSNKTLSKKSKQSSKMSWHAFSNRMSACGSCKSTWPDEGWLGEDLRSCSIRLNKKAQPKQSCSEQ